MQNLKRGKHFDLTSAQDKENPNCIVFANNSLIFLRDLFSYPSDEEFEELGSLEITDAFIDECAQVVRKAKDILKVRIRYKLDEFGLKPKILYATNPTKNWAYDEFYRANKDKVILPYRKFVQAFVWDNPHVSEAYVNSLRQMRDGPEKERLYFGNWEYSDIPERLCEFDAISDMFTNDHVLPTGKKYISADLAMQGRDRFIAGSWDGLIAKIDIDKKISTGKEIENDLKTLMIKESVPRSQTIADSDGLGAYLESYLTGIKEFHGGAQAIDKIEFANLKSECGYKLAEYVNKREIKIICTMEQRERIVQEMGVLRSKSVSNDEKKKQIISKDEMKAILNRSPDYLDFLLMRMYFDTKPKFVVAVA